MKIRNAYPFKKWTTFNQRHNRQMDKLLKQMAEKTQKFDKAEKSVRKLLKGWTIADVETLINSRIINKAKKTAKV